MKTKAIKYMMLMLLCLLPAAVSAQGVRITGKVMGDGEPIMMGNVVELDANKRIVTNAVTDINGNFSMTVKNTKNRLRVTYIGFQEYSTVIGNTRNFNITLKDQTQLVEVVVTQKRKTSHGGLEIPEREAPMASQRFDMSEVEGLAFTSADEALQGQIAGLDIVSNSGNLGSGTQMRLRGVTSINGDSNPLIVVDGNIFDNPDESFDFDSANEETYAALLSVNPGDIEEINVLKDAGATAIWGSQGANGVIEIKTKRGKRGPIKVSYNLRVQANWQPKGYNLLSGDDYTMMLKEMYYNPTQSPTATQNIRELNYDTSWAEYENWNNNTDWVDAVTQTGWSQYHYLTITGGGEKANFRVSAGYDHENGTMIKQQLDRFSTRLALDYFVSDRITFRTTFPLTYTKNQKNAAGLLGIAQKLAPNMSIYRQDANGNDTNEYYVMLPDGGSDAVGSSLPNTSAHQLRDIRGLGNPVAIAHEAWNNESTYRISPEFKVDYDLLGLENDQTRLKYSGSIYLDLYSNNTHSFWPASLQTFNGAADWQTADDYNKNTTKDSGRMSLNTRHQLVLTPYFRNQDWSMTMMGRWEMGYNQSTNQTVGASNLPDGINQPTVGVRLNDLGTGNGEGRSMSASFSGHFAYKGRYILDPTLRADGTTRFGKGNKWGYFPALSARWNISDESFFKFAEPVVSMLAIRGSWGVSGKTPKSEYLQYTRYNTSGDYGAQDGKQSVTYLEGLQLNNLKWERTSQWNIGADLALFDGRVNADFNWYYKYTKDLLNEGVRIPSTSGFTTLAWCNVGDLSNKGWELNVRFNDIIRWNDFRVSANFNIAQNFNRIEEMDDNVLAGYNNDWVAGNRGEYLKRIQVGNPLGSIFGLRSKGVYQYSYEWLTDQRDENGWDVETFRNKINGYLAEGKTFPVATDEDGKVLINRNGDPVRLVYNYENGQQTYTFQGGDAIYEDVNHDGQINAQDIVYLGNSNPKVNGGFGLNFRYRQWQLRTNFNYRYGFKLINKARMELEQMFNAYNQSTAVNFRWRQDGDQTIIPRAMYNTAYNFLGSDRYVESGSFVRMSYVQLSWNAPSKAQWLKSMGLSRLQASISMQNPFVWSNYSGTDPEHSSGAFGIATDNSQTPRSKSVTANVTVEF